MSRKVIVYDASCPMCRWYTGEFVRLGILGPEDRVSFTELDRTDLLRRIDLRRAPNEIPLVDRDRSETLYGVDAMICLLARRFPRLPQLVRLHPVDWFVRRLYKFVSYNRRTIAPSVKAAGGVDCTPDFDWFYRGLYLLFALATGAVLLPLGLFASLLFPLLFLFILKNPEHRMEWAGQVATVLLVGALLCLPLRLFPSFEWTAPIVVGGMAFWQWIRRWKIFRKNTVG